MACETVCTFFYVFLRFFQNPKKHDFLRFFELLHTFSRTVALPNTYNTNFAFKSFVIVAITLAIILHYHCRFNLFSGVYRSILICIVL